MPGNQVKLQKGICLWSRLLLPPKNPHQMGQLYLILHKRHIKRKKLGLDESGSDNSILKVAKLPNND
jgi:hypothetical protein